MINNLKMRDKITGWANVYEAYSNPKKGKLLKPEFKNNPLFLGCTQWTFTDLDLFDIDRHIPKNIQKTSTFTIIQNHELLLQLLANGFSIDQMSFVSDCPYRTHGATNLGIKDVVQLPVGNKELRKFVKNMKKNKNMKKTNYVLNNLPFNLFADFKEMATELATEKALIIAGAGEFHGGAGFDNVEVYKFLGKPFDATIEASLIIVNPQGADELTIYDDDNTAHKVAANPIVTPGKGFTFDAWRFAEDVVRKNLKGITSASRGKLTRSDATIVPNGIPVIFSSGKKDAAFGPGNQASNLGQLNNFNTYCWATICNSQKSLVAGLGVHKVVVSHNTSIGYIGNLKYAGPEMGCSMNCWYIPCTSKKDALAWIKYLNHPSVTKLVKELRGVVVSQSAEVWGRIPHITEARKWIKNYA